MGKRSRLCGLALLAWAVLAQAETISQFSPQGTVNKVRQARATFSEPAVKAGDPRAPTPFDIQCSQAGSGRWADERNWVYDFKGDLPAGVSCRFTLKKDFRLLSGAPVQGTASFQFGTGGPVVQRMVPSEWTPLDEDQVFLAVQNGQATEASLLAHVHCEAEGIQERIPVKLVTGPVREALIKRFAEKTPPERLTTLQCAQRLPNEAAVRLVWGKGVATPTGMATTEPQHFDYKVRRAFTASVSCERENARAGCMPLSPLTLSFSAPIKREMAQKIVLGGSSRKYAPVIEGDDNADMVTLLTFKPNFPENTRLVLELPHRLVDDAGRPLANASLFPMHLHMAAYPPLAKFAAAPFGIIELDDAPAMPVTVRGIEAAAAPMLASLKVEGDAAIMAWMKRLNRYHENVVDIDGKGVQTRSLALLDKEPAARRTALPGPHVDGGAQRPFEVIGIPMPGAGFYVMELASTRLGTALLDKPAPMYVRTSALVTNLAVHVKVGRENGAVWVTTLDAGKPVPDADVRISDCVGKELWRGRTGADGVALVPRQLDAQCNNARWDNRLVDGLFVSARALDARGKPDMAFALTSWNDGIEPFRFNLPVDTDAVATRRAHTVFDRTLFRAGQTVSMKHLMRVETGKGLALPPAGNLPNRVRIVHQGSGQEFRFPLAWRGEGSAETSFAIPAQARLGRYDVMLDHGQAKPGGDSVNDDGDSGGGQGRRYITGSFRVEEFRLPVLQGRIAPPKSPQVAPKEVPLTVQLNYLNGGGAAGLPVELTALMRKRTPSFPAYEEFRFSGRNAENEEEQKVVADKLAVRLDRNGIASTAVRELPAITGAAELLAEMRFADPNGEIQTVSQIVPLWPAAVVAGIKMEDWVSAGRRSRLTALALDLEGRPRANVAMEISAVRHSRNAHRKRMVGGFYAYENETVSKELGRLCSGKSDARGLFVCEADLGEAGEVELTARASDDNGRHSRASTTVWISGADDVWFGAGNQDRMDLLPERKQYQPGETAVFQARMPFRQASALVAIEREGVLETRVVQLSGRDPVIRVPVTAAHAPNVYVSVLAVRGRLREVPWYSFFTWGWREPRTWLADFRTWKAPGPTVDLARPAFRFGIAEIAVGTAGYKLDVKVDAAQSAYPVRGKALVTIKALLPDGKPAAGAEVAVAAVDEALLELQSNASWDVLPAMLQRRGYGVQTATAQMQVVGKRHFGRKAMPAGGGGGRAATRELTDTLLLWRPAIRLDGQGSARVEVPLNDALSSFRIVAVATSGAALFGHGQTSIRTTQDVQLIAGLPPLVRQGDRYSAMATVRNGAERDMELAVSASVDGRALEAAPRKVTLAAGQAQELRWDVTAPADGERLAWELKAQETGGVRAADALRVEQKLLPAVPVTVQQASLFQLDGTRSIALAQAADAVPGRGGIALSLSPSLAGAADGLRRYFREYPYSCLEQKTSRAIGLDDQAAWQRLMAELPLYLDSDGLARYYPSSSADTHGSTMLTSYLLAISHEAGLALPEQSRERMLLGLQAYVEGRIDSHDWAPRKDGDTRRLAALEAMSRYDRMPARGLDAIQIQPGIWPTSALLDWIAILRRTPGLPNHARRLQDAEHELRARLNFQGTRMGFSTEASDYWWWQMAGADANAVRMVLASLDDAAWREDLPRLLTGAIARQQRGHWNTTTANAWGTLALRKFSARFETEVPGGTLRAQLRQGGTERSASHAWTSGAGKIELPWKAAAPRPDDVVTLTQQGPGKPWVTLQNLAAVPLKAPFSSGYRINRKTEMVEQQTAGTISRGDVMRITLEVEAQADMSQVVVADPVPAGTTILGSGLGRDSAIASAGNARPSGGWLAFEERSFDSFRAYYSYLPKGTSTISYTVRLNNPGRFQLPPTRVEAMYAPEMHGMAPNAALEVR